MNDGYAFSTVTGTLPTALRLPYMPACRPRKRERARGQFVQGDPSGGEPELGGLRFGKFPRLVAAAVATYCQSRMVEHPKSKST